jgi:hypothetical protein
MSKAAIQQKGLNKAKEKFLSTGQDNLQYRGIYCGELVEPMPKFIEAPCETVYQGKNSSYIVLGRDRPGNRLSGYGGKGDTQASMIDIVVGRMSYEAKDTDANGEPLYADPDVRRDAARIYISQKSDIDEYFKLAPGVVGNAIAKSAIAIKADNLRLISREGIKLITSTDPKNSQGGTTRTIGGIDLIAGNNDDDMQPLVKGKNISEFLNQIITKISELDGTLINFVNYQMKFNNATLQHYHYSPFFGIATTPDLDVLSTMGLPQVTKMVSNTIPALVKHKMNLKIMGANYLKSSGAKYINSRNNNTN